MTTPKTIMHLINRSAIIVKPKQPYIDWANYFDDGGPTLTLEKGRRDPSVFLADDVENDPEPERIVKQYYNVIFEHELRAWMTTEHTWPRKRDLRTFLEWFDVDICTMVIDLSSAELEQE